MLLVFQYQMKSFPKSIIQLEQTICFHIIRRHFWIWVTNYSICIVFKKVFNLILVRWLCQPIREKEIELKSRLGIAMESAVFELILIVLVTILAYGFTLWPITYESYGRTYYLWVIFMTHQSVCIDRLIYRLLICGSNKF